VSGSPSIEQLLISLFRKDYIRFYHLRSYDRINAPWPSFIKQMEEHSGISFHQAQVALAKQWIGTPETWSQPNVSIKQPDPTREGIVIEDTQVKIETVEFPPTVEAAVEIVEKFEAGGVGLRDDIHVSDSIAHHALMDDTSLLQEKWLGTDQEELDRYAIVPLSMPGLTPLQLRFRNSVHSLEADDSG
jgi:phospholipase D1/2